MEYYKNYDKTQHNEILRAALQHFKKVDLKKDKNLRSYNNGIIKTSHRVQV